LRRCSARSSQRRRKLPPTPPETCRGSSDLAPAGLRDGTCLPRKETNQRSAGESPRAPGRSTKLLRANGGKGRSVFATASLRTAKGARATPIGKGAGMVRCEGPLRCPFGSPAVPAFKLPALPARVMSALGAAIYGGGGARRRAMACDGH
jgi:hypothetical protein